MAGLKTFWITISALLFLAACVPQSKQTECGSNEAFNATLRTCVPIVGGPESFVQVANYSPSSAVSKSKGDFSFIPLSITLSNPYNQAYTITWERVYNNVGTVVPLSTCSNALSCNILRGYDLGTTNGEIGLHIVTAKVRVNGNVVDTHSFEVKVNDLPKPTIVNASVLPSPTIYNLDFTPVHGPQEFSFVINNNSTLSNTAGWRTSWVVTKNGVLVTSPVMNVGDDAFTNFGSTQQNSAYLGTAVTATFNPSTLGVGSYTIRAIVQNTTPGEVVDERLWTVTVKHPDIGTIAGITQPATSVDTFAFHGVTYADYGFFDSASFPLAKSYCVAVSNPEGAYTDGSVQDQDADGLPPFVYKNILVRYYKDGVGSPIYEGRTSAIDNEVCFSDAAAERTALFFSDGSSSVPHYKKLVARVFDEQTGNEMCVNGGSTCTVTYPVEWRVLVKPQNTAPTVRILPAAAGSAAGTSPVTGTNDRITYASIPSTSTVNANATVRQDDVVTIRFRITDDFFEHDPIANPEKFRITSSLMRGTTLVSNTICVKDWADPYTGVTSNPTPGASAAKDIDVACTFTIASSTASGPVPPDAHVLTIQVEDLDSPATIAANGGTTGIGGKLATLLTWNLSVVESNTAPTIAFTQYIINGVAGAVAADEGHTIVFQFAITDAEKDSYTLTVKKCANAACANSGLTDFPGNTVTQAFGVPGYGANIGISYQVPQDAIGNAATGQLHFKVIMSDVPNNPTLGLAAIQAPTLPQMTVDVNQVNHAPVINEPLMSPLPNTAGTAYNAFSGFKFEISAAAVGAVTDASNVSSENMSAVKYRWWIKPDGAGTWTSINGVIDPLAVPQVPISSSTLKWTPGPELSGLQNIKLCVSDESVLRPNIDQDPSVASTICSDTYFVNVRPNLAKLTTPAETLNGEVAVHHVPGERIAYVAYASPSKIYVEKVVYDATGQLNTGGMAVAAFNTAGAGLTASQVKNLSLTASANHLYVAYMSDTSAAPGNFSARVRMINISTTNGTKTGTEFLANNRMFDFSYSPISVTVSCGASNCDYEPTTREIVFDGTALTPGTDQVEISVTHPVPFRTTSYVIPVSAASPTPLGSICANCTAPVQAQNFVDAINQASTDFNADASEVQGLVARLVAGGTVQLYGLENNSFYDGVDVATGVGKIVIYGTKWFLPVINASLGGANQNKIQLLSDDLGDMTPGTGAIIDTEPVSAVDNALTIATTPNGRMLLSYITLSGSVAKACLLSEADDFEACAAAPITLFGGTGMNLIKSRPYLSNNLNNFFVGRDSSNVWRVARVNSTLTTITRENTLLAYRDTADTTNNSILSATISDVDIQPAPPQTPAVTSNEARLLVSSNFGGSYKSYLMRWRQILLTPFEAIDAGGGQRLELTGETITSTSKVVLSPISSVTLGNGGSVTSDHTNSAAAIVRINNSGAFGRAEFGIVNIETETINSTTREPSGDFSPALVR